MNQLPLLAITMGDPAGTGPEIITKSLEDPEIYTICRPMVVGDAAIMQQAQGFTGAKVSVRAVNSPENAGTTPGQIDVLDLGNVDAANLKLGAVSPEAGKAAYEYIEKATLLTLDGQADAVVTSAINKEALNLAGYHFDGHTGLLAHLCKSPGATMMLVADNLRVSHVSTHVPLRVAIDRVQPERIVRVLELTQQAIQQLGIPNPRLAVAGLNPHAGENGLFGDEEQTKITPAIEEARRRGIDAHGPYAGDTIFFRSNQKEFDGAVAMYHDQGHVAAKMLGIWLGVNVTLGLPIIRTSVEHGTNFDMTGTGKSDCRSLTAAIKLAAQMASNRQNTATA
jgi:4-phospho-D-threonate 3-dehydrogenase / 4-phospho-D-erythronate 3-dehydrogenase